MAQYDRDKAKEAYALRKLGGRIPKDLREKGKIRKCLMCRNRFLSEGIWNRVCDICKASDIWRGQ